VYRTKTRESTESATSAASGIERGRGRTTTSPNSN